MIAQEGAYDTEFIPATRLGRTEDIVGTMLYMASEAGAYLNGNVRQTHVLSIAQPGHVFDEADAQSIAIPCFETHRRMLTHVTDTGYRRREDIAAQRHVLSKIFSQRSLVSPRDRARHASP